MKIHGEPDGEGHIRRKFRIGTFVELGHGSFTVDDIEKQELEMLHLLKWKINPPTSLRFLTSYLRLWPACISHENHLAVTEALVTVTNCARYLTELSVCVSRVALHCKASVIAYASLGSTMEKSTLPHHFQVMFLGDIARATGVDPASRDVRQARSILKEACPIMSFVEDFAHPLSADSAADNVHGRNSPFSFVGTKSNVQFLQNHSRHESGPIRHPEEGKEIAAPRLSASDRKRSRPREGSDHGGKDDGRPTLSRRVSR